MAEPTHGNAPAPAPAVAVALVAHNSGRYLAACLAALNAQSFRDFEILILDNGSTDGSIEALPPLPANARLIRLGANLGFAAANNRAAALTDAPLLALLNPDTVAAPDWLERLVAAARRHAEIAMFGSTQLQLADPGRYDGLGDVYHAAGVYWRGGYGRRVGGPLVSGEVFAPCAAAALYRRERFLAAGGFDERFFCYGEDVDLAFRLRLAGDRALQVADAVVRHAGAVTAGRYSDFSVYHGVRNRAWVFAKNMPAPLLWPLLPAHLLATLLLLLANIARGIGRPTLRGLRDALCALPEILRSRRAIQRGRRAPALDIARAMVWLPHLPMLRAPSSRALSRPAPD